MNKICSICKELKSLDDFYMCPFTKDKHQSQCKICTSKKSRIWQKMNRDKVRISQNKYAASHKEQRKLNKLKWDKKAMKNPLFRLSNNIRGNMHHALKAKKAGRTWESLVGYTLEDLIKHLENKFSSGITWDNYGSVSR